MASSSSAPRAKPTKTSLPKRVKILNIPNITELRQIIDYGHPHSRRDIDFYNAIRTFCVTFTSKHGIPGPELLSWKNNEHHQGLLEMTHSFLELGGKGSYYWPDDPSSPYFGKLSYSKNQQLIKRTMQQLFFRINQQQKWKARKPETEHTGSAGGLRKHKRPRIECRRSSRRLTPQDGQSAARPIDIEAFGDDDCYCPECEDRMFGDEVSQPECLPKLEPVSPTLPAVRDVPRRHEPYFSPILGESIDGGDVPNQSENAAASSGATPRQEFDDLPGNPGPSAPPLRSASPGRASPVSKRPAPPSADGDISHQDKRPRQDNSGSASLRSPVEEESHVAQDPVSAQPSPSRRRRQTQKPGYLTGDALEEAMSTPSTDNSRPSPELGDLQQSVERAPSTIPAPVAPMAPSEAASESSEYAHAETLKREPFSQSQTPAHLPTPSFPDFPPLPRLFDESGIPSVSESVYGSRSELERRLQAGSSHPARAQTASPAPPAGNKASESPQITQALVIEFVVNSSGKEYVKWAPRGTFQQKSLKELVDEIPLRGNFTGLTLSLETPDKRWKANVSLGDEHAFQELKHMFQRKIKACRDDHRDLGKDGTLYFEIMIEPLKLQVVDNHVDSQQSDDIVF